MREIKDTKRIEQIYQTVQHCFRLRPPVLRLLQFEKEELLNHPLRPQEQFLIVAEGSVAIYDLSEDGGIRYVSRTGTGTLLGDVEFCGADGGAFYTGRQNGCSALPSPLPRTGKRWKMTRCSCSLPCVRWRRN